MDIVKCNRCGHVLISGNGCLAMFGKGTKLGCNKCGASYTFGEEKPKEEPKIIEGPGYIVNDLGEFYEIGEETNVK